MGALIFRSFCKVLTASPPTGDLLLGTYCRTAGYGAGESAAVLSRPGQQAVSVRSQLNPISQTALKIVHKILSGSPIAASDHPGTNELGIGIHRNPRPSISSARAAFAHLVRNVAFFGRDEAPYLIALNPFAWKIYEGFVQVFRARRSEFDQQFCNCIFGNSGHANRRTDRIAFDKGCNHLS